jgi:hypothetical protein
MEHVAEVLEAARDPWSLVALLLLGFFALTWKYGKEILAVMRETRTAAHNTNLAVQKVEESIVTNHGSKNIGDAVDRLTEWFMEHREEAEERQRVQNLLVQKFDQHIEDCAPLRDLANEIHNERRHAGAHH